MFRQMPSHRPGSETSRHFRTLNLKTQRSALSTFCCLLLTAGLAPILSTASSARGLQQAQPELVLQTGHTGAINAIALSGDGRVLVSASQDGTLKIWDISTGNVLRTLYGHDKPVISAAISPDNKVIASGGDDRTARVWDVLTGRSRTLATHSSRVKELVFSTDGTILTSLGNNEAKLTEVSTGREIRSIKLSDDKSGIDTSSDAATMDQIATALSLDGRLGAVGGGMGLKKGFLGIGAGVRANPVRLIDLNSGREIETFKLRGEWPTPTELRFSPDGRLLAAKFIELAGRQDHGQRSWVMVFEVTTGREVKRLQTGDATGTGGIAFSPDGKMLASRMTAMPDPNVTDPAKLAESRSGAIKLYDVATWSELRELSKIDLDFTFQQSLSATPLSFSPDGKYLAASLATGVVMFDTGSGNKVQNLRTRERASAVAAAPASPSQPSQSDMMRQAGVSPEMMQQIQEMLGNVLDTAAGRGLNLSGRSAINFSADGRLLTTLGSAVVWDVAAGTPQQRRQGQGSDQAMMGRLMSGEVRNADGSLSAVASYDTGGSKVLIIDAASGKELPIRVGKSTSVRPGMDMPARISSLAFSAKGLVVYYCEYKVDRGRFGMGGGMSQECRVATFDPRSGQQIKEMKIENDKNSFMGMGDGNATAMSPDGRFLVAIVMETPGGGFGFKTMLPSIGRGGGGDALKQPYKIRLTDLDSGRKVWELKGESEDLMTPPSFVFSPNGAVLAITTMEKKKLVLNFYDTASSRKITSLDPGDRKIKEMRFSPDGKSLALTYGVDQEMAGFISESRRASQRASADNDLVTIHDLSTGRQTLTLTHDTRVNGVAFSPSGKLIATLGQDRNQYLWDALTGQKVVTLVNLETLNFMGASEWLVVTPDGLFDGSPAAWQQIMWRFSEDTFDVGPVEIFFNELYHPGLLSDIFTDKRPKAPRSLQQIDRRQPKVKISTNESAGGEINSRTVNVKIEVVEAAADAAHPKGSGARDVRLFRNGTMVKLWRGDVLNGKTQTTLEAALPIVAGENLITAYAFNQDNVKSSDAFLSLKGSKSLARKGIAYVIAFGVNEYANTQYNLKYAGADATAFAAEVKTQQLKLDKFERVEVVSLLDKDATKANLLAALKRLSGVDPGATVAPELAKLERAQPEDSVIIYFAGHGTAKGARFYLVPHDLGYSGPRAGIDAAAVETILSHSVSDLELEAAVEGLDASGMLLVIDACNSGQALEAEEKRRGPMNSKGLAQLAYEKGMFILTAAQSYQAALEAAQLGHGYLTYALVEEGLKKGSADRASKDGQVSVHEWFDYAAERVPEMQEQNSGGRLLLEEETKAKDRNQIRSVQRPRAFYRRSAEVNTVIIARP